MVRARRLSFRGGRRSVLRLFNIISAKFRGGHGLFCVGFAALLSVNV